MNSSFYARFFGSLALAALGYALFLIFRPFLGPILWAVLIAFLLHPVNRALRGRLRGSAGGAAGVLTLAVTVGLATPAVLLAMVLAGQASDLAGDLSAAAARYQIARPSDIFRIPALGTALEWIEARVPITADQVQSWLLQLSQRILRSLASSTGTIFLSALGALVSIVLMLFVLFFFLRDGDRMVTSAVGLIPMAPERRSHLVDHVAAVIRAEVFGSLLTALVQGLLVGVGFALVGLPSPVVFGAVAAVAALVPLIGTALAGCPARARCSSRDTGSRACSCSGGAWPWCRPRTTWCGRCSSRAAPRSPPCRCSWGCWAG